MFGKCCGCSKTHTENTINASNENINLRNSDTNVIKSDNMKFTNFNVVSVSDKSTNETRKQSEHEESSLSMKETPSIVVEQPNSATSVIYRRQSTISDTKVEDYDHDDDVFCEGLGPPMKLANNLGTSYFIKEEQEEIQLPQWFSEDEQEVGGIQEPPATPVGRDELALRRHRFFSELLNCTRNITEHKVRFDPLGPVIAGGERHLVNIDVYIHLLSLITIETKSFK